MEQATHPLAAGPLAEAHDRIADEALAPETGPAHTGTAPARPAPAHARLSEPQRSLIEKLQQGASLVHEAQTTGLFRLMEADRGRTIHPATAQALLNSGILHKDMLGICRLSPGHVVAPLEQCK